MIILFCSNLLFSCSVVYDTLQPHGLRHDRLPCPLPSPGTYSHSGPLSLQCHPTISYSDIPFSSCLLSFPASGSFPMCRLFESCGQSIGASASASVLPINIQDWFHLGLTGLISCPRDSQESSSTQQFEGIRPSTLSLFYYPALISIHNYWKNHSFDYLGFCRQSDISAF